ncbi:unnamed protein product [Urochloa decumbens]|uniref:Uncharacterized protein n=1 Tax=Urochloa decumbens TaxID=240449 RepID=A0ABC9BUD3_9POAL
MGEEPAVNSPHQRPRRWRQASLVWNASRGFISDPRRPQAPDVNPHQVHGAERRDLEGNSPPAPPTASGLVRLLSRSVLVRQIRRISQLVPAVGISLFRYILILLANNCNLFIRSPLSLSLICCPVGNEQVFHGTPEDQLKQQHKRCSKYSQKALLFAITTFVAYLGSSSSSSTGNIAFKIAMAAFLVAIPIDLISATRTPKWGCALVYLSWFLLVLLSYILLVSFHKDYSYAIIPVLLLVFAALLQCKLRPTVRQQSTTNIAEPSQHPNSKNEADRDLGTDDMADQDFENIFDWSAGLVNCGGLVSMILGHYNYMIGPNQAASVIGFLFFFTVVLGLYLMMVTTVRAAALTLYIRYLAYLLDVLLVGTLTATFIHGFWVSRNNQEVARGNSASRF